MGALTWEPIDRMPRTVSVEQIQSVDEVVTAVSDGYLYLSVRQRTSVKLFTILGQPVMHSVVNPGNYRLRLPARGIYLLKIGGATRRVTI